MVTMTKTFKVLLIGGKLIQDHEFFYPRYRVTEEDNFHLSIATPQGAECQTNKGTVIKPDLSIEAANPDDFDALIIPGGAHAIEYVRQIKELIDLTSAMNSQGKVIASICQGSQILISAKVVKGRNVSGYYSIRDDIENAGGFYTDEKFVTDNNLVTTAHYKDLGPWMKEFVRLVNLS